jgi:hypothetical protein
MRMSLENHRNFFTAHYPTMDECKAHIYKQYADTLYVFRNPMPPGVTENNVVNHLLHQGYELKFQLI